MKKILLSDKKQTLIIEDDQSAEIEVKVLYCSYCDQTGGVYTYPCPYCDYGLNYLKL